MNKKILWKIEELWEKFYGKNTCHSELISESKILVKNNTCPVNDIQLADINTENNSPFGFYSKKQNKYHLIPNSHSVIPAKSEISIFKKLYKNNISIYNPDFHIVSKFNFEPSEKPVYNDEYGEYFGLKYSQVLEKKRKLIYLFDNHNKIIQPFLEYAEIFGKGFDVVHIDAHDDDAVFAGQKPQNLELGKVQEYIMQTRISDFFDFLDGVYICHSCMAMVFRSQKKLASCHCEPAKQSQEICHPELISGSTEVNSGKLIQNIHRYTKSADFQAFKKQKNHYILSLDIDIFGPEGDFVDLELKVRIIAEAWQHADVVCIATSPGFIDQEYAQEVIEIFLK